MKIPTVPVTKKEPYKYPGIPEPRLDLESLYETVEVLKEIVETLIGQRGDGGSALTEDTATDPMKVMTVHLHEDNPHDQYVLNEEALRTFTFAAYAGLTQSTSGVAYPDLGAGWRRIPFP